MRANDPVVTFFLVLVIGIVVGVLLRPVGRAFMASSPVLRIGPRYHHECASGRSWRVRRLSHRCAACVPRRAGNVGHCGSDRCRGSAVRLADG